MRRLILPIAARRDLAGIARHIVRESGAVAVGKGFVGRLRSRCNALAALPGTLGVARPEYGRGYRSVVEGNYLIVFRYEPTAVRVIRIIEGHRDVARQLRADTD